MQERGAWKTLSGAGIVSENGAGRAAWWKAAPSAAARQTDSLRCQVSRQP